MANHPLAPDSSLTISPSNSSEQEIPKQVGCLRSEAAGLGRAGQG